MWQKDSGILYKRWMESSELAHEDGNVRWDGKQRQGGGGGNGEKAEESRQRPLSRQETSWTRSKKIICVGEKKYREPGRLTGALTDIFSMCAVTRDRGTTKL